MDVDSVTVGCTVTAGSSLEVGEDIIADSVDVGSMIGIIEGDACVEANVACAG
jgi:hypothetical protein